MPEINPDWSKYWLQFNEANTPATNYLHPDAISNMSSEHLVLDLGCGYGRNIQNLANIALRVVGVDINHEEVKHASLGHQEENINFAVMNGAQLGFADNTFNDVVLLGVIGGIHSEMRHKIIEESVRVLKPGGMVYLGENTVDSTVKIKQERYSMGKEITGEDGTMVVYNNDQSAEGIAFISKHFEPEEIKSLLSEKNLEGIEIRTPILSKPSLFNPGKTYDREALCAWAFKEK